MHASGTLLFFQLFCVLKDFCNKQLKKIAWKENNEDLGSPTPRVNPGADVGEGRGMRREVNRASRTEGATWRWETTSRVCPTWVKWAQWTVPGCHMRAQPILRIWPTLVAWADEYPLMHSLSSSEGISPTDASMEPSWSNKNNAHPWVCVYIYIPRDLPYEKNPIFNGSEHS